MSTMQTGQNFLETQQYDFNDTSFKLLLQKRIHKVLLICSNYDAFMLEEDGRIDEQIFNEYVSLNLRYPPTFSQVDSESKAFKILASEQIDLVILSRGSLKLDTFGFARKLKSKYPDIPVVLLAYFSREVRLKMEEADLSSIDYVFSWLGNADLLMAIIKLIEDKMNVSEDVKRVGVQTILLVEDSVRYVSSYLPELYKIILKQSREFQCEALNEHDQMLRMRGRPKILLASNYEEAIALFNRYKDNMLGVISDIRFSRKGKIDPEAGIRFCRHVKTTDKHMPVLLQSSDVAMEQVAREMDAGFLNKFSKSLSHKLKKFLVKNLAFGPFIFRNPETLEEIARAENLQEFQQKLMTIPESSLAWHSRRNDFSKWLNARALFPLAQMFKYLKIEDFQSVEEVRRFLYSTISSFRLGKGRGVIAKFDRTNFDEYLTFSRIGNGSIGGKARGLAFLNTIIKKNRLFNKYPGVFISVPKSVVISTDIFDEFMESNNLYDIGLSDRPDEEILEYFIRAELPGDLLEDLKVIVKVFRKPIAIRSSSKLEDSHYQPFAGIYSTYMIPMVNDIERMVDLLAAAIKEVYASVYYQTSKAYMEVTSNVIDEEKMGIILQEVCGSTFGDLYFPSFSGVVRSINFYPVGNEKSADGIVRVGVGLGKLIVEGGASLRFSPKFPRKILQLSSPDMALKTTQKYLYALDLKSGSIFSVDDGINIKKIPVSEIESIESFKYLASTYDFENQMVREGILGKGKRIISFAQVLNGYLFPLAEILNDLLNEGKKEMDNPVEIEFAVDMENGNKGPVFFNVLQIRPIVDAEEMEISEVKMESEENTLIYSESAMGNGVICDTGELVYVKPGAFNPAATKHIAESLNRLNETFKKENRPYILVGPGRWGSRDPWLGIPVKWPNISQAKLIVEYGLENFRVDPSQGTHFFQNLTSFRVGYFTINPYLNDGFFDTGFLDRQPAVYEDKYLRHIRFNAPLVIKIDGLHNRGIVLKPKEVVE